jgi:hypothetical protein
MTDDLSDITSTHFQAEELGYIMNIPGQTRPCSDWPVSGHPLYFGLKLNMLPRIAIKLSDEDEYLPIEAFRSVVAKFNDIQFYQLMRHMYLAGLLTSDDPLEEEIFCDWRGLCEDVGDFESFHGEPEDCLPSFKVFGELHWDMEHDNVEFVVVDSEAVADWEDLREKIGRVWVREEGKVLCPAKFVGVKYRH